MASQAVAEVVAAGLDGSARVLDLCAAPGGKATAVAAAGPRVVAADIRPSRLGLVADNAFGLGLAVGLVAADGRRPPFRPGSFDRVLVDAPCSGLGVLRRRADARWRVRPDDIERLADLQVELLAAAVSLVHPGGRLVYSVCTVTAAETTGVEARFRERTGLEPLGAPDGPWRPHGGGGLVLPQDLDGEGMAVAVYPVG